MQVTYVCIDVPSPAKQWNHNLDHIDGDLQCRRSEREQHATQASAHNIRMSGQREGLDPEGSDLDTAERQEWNMQLPFNQ